MICKSYFVFPVRGKKKNRRAFQMFKNPAIFTMVFSSPRKFLTFAEFFIFVPTDRLRKRHSPTIFTRFDPSHIFHLNRVPGGLYGLYGPTTISERSTKLMSEK